MNGKAYRNLPRLQRNIEHEIYCVLKESRKIDEQTRIINQRLRRHGRIKSDSSDGILTYNDQRVLLDARALSLRARIETLKLKMNWLEQLDRAARANGLVGVYAEPEPPPPSLEQAKALARVMQASPSGAYTREREPNTRDENRKRAKRGKRLES
jgi:hypothetical protein